MLSFFFLGGGRKCSHIDRFFTGEYTKNKLAFQTGVNIELSLPFVSRNISDTLITRLWRQTWGDYSDGQDLNDLWFMLLVLNVTTESRDLSSHSSWICTDLCQACRWWDCGYPQRTCNFMKNSFRTEEERDVRSQTQTKWQSCFYHSRESGFWETAPHPEAQSEREEGNFWWCC